MDPDLLFARYQELQRYVSWTDADADRIHALAPVLVPRLPALIDEFYAEIERHPDARKVITGGQEQIARLKGTLRTWLGELIAGPYDKDYVTRRWRVGWRHVEIGLSQVFTNVALSRLRGGLLHVLDTDPAFSKNQLPARRSLNMLIDLDLAIIEEAYQLEYMQRLQRSERLAAIGQIAGGIAHELRNPLNVVKTSIYYLINAKRSDPAKTAEHLQRIERQVNLSDNVITALSNFAKMPMPNLRPFDLQAFLGEVLETTAVPQQVEVAIVCPPPMPAVLADPDQLRIVFGNLIRNASDAMPSGGRLTITARQAREAVEVEVADTGTGIAAEHLSRIMEPLYSTKARGLGLGLAIVRSILDKNKGSLRVVSQPGQGTTFTVSLVAGSA